jgi:hypothetical protein
VRLIRLAILFATALAILGVMTPASAGASPYCGITWGSGPKVHEGVDSTREFIDDIRVGRHACFDRLVIDLGDAPGFDAYSVSYPPNGVQDPTGAPIPLRGAADLEIEVWAKPFDADSVFRYEPADLAELVDVRGFRTLRQVSWAGAAGDRTVIGIGTRARLPFRVLVLPGPAAGQQRLVIDIAHRW